MSDAKGKKARLNKRPDVAYKTAAEIADIFTEKFAQDIISSEVREWSEGAKKTPVFSLWIKLNPSRLHDAVETLIKTDYPHLGVISAVDCKDTIALLYHLYVFYGLLGKEVCVTFEVELSKENPVIGTISDLIPGAVYSEREKREMIGVEIEGIPDKRGLFLPQDFPKNTYPWRKDETGIKDSLVKDLWAVGRPKNRPLPHVLPKPEKKKETAESAPEKNSAGDE
ncbi:MAG: NADH-quinone oxidoreductase subunit C [Methanomicrobium sp.]|nr:NADH-quinone oxidoreductase subunit C [Methanomicrobium sp.]MDD4300259.1 NADH-quinone oxidoreductase subunit C [Methanomicrobium sp.]